MTSPRRPRRSAQPYDLTDHLVFRLALFNCLEGLKAHGRRCGCLDCRGWRSFIAAAGKRGR